MYEKNILKKVSPAETKALIWRAMLLKMLLWVLRNLESTTAGKHAQRAKKYLHR